MEIFRGIDGLPPALRGVSAALGNFDGVHLGHQSVIALARAAAGELGCPSAVLTFEPHPRQFFAPDAPAFRLMNAASRADRLARLGLDLLVELPFDGVLAAMPAREFAERVLSRGLGLGHLTVGADFRFGKGRSGDAALLQQLGPALGFGVTVAPLVSDHAGDYSSSAIRAALSSGNPQEAARMLGHWHHVDGLVQSGDRRGRTLGFPTINLALDGLHPPRFGVYAVTVDVLTGPHSGQYPGAASIGVRPTFGINKPNLEVFLLDFSGDLYGARVSVALRAYLRDELRFDTVEDLVRQMQADCDAARAVLSGPS